MAEQKNSMPPRRPGGPGHGPRSHGYQRPQDLRGTVKKLLHYVGRYKGLLVLVAICLLLSSVGSVASSYFLKPAINDYILPGDFAGLLKLLVLMGLVFVLSALCSYVYSRIMVRVSQRTVAALRQDLFDKLQELPLRYFDTHLSGDLMSRFTNDIDTVSEMINNSFANVLSNSLTFLCTIGMLLYLNWALTLITFAFLGLMLLVVKVIGGRSRVSFQRQQAALGDLNGYIEEMIEGQKVIKVFHHEQQAIDQFSARNDTYQTAATMAQTYAGSMMPATANLSRINYAVTCCVGGLLAMGGVFDIGSLGAYLLYVKQVSQPVSQISQQVNTILAAIAGAERIFAVMEAQPEEDEGQTTIVRVEKHGDTLTEVPQRTGHWAWKKPDGSLTELRGDVRFDHVTFGYEGSEETVIRDFSADVKAGQKIAIVGPTGAGKTTMVKLLMRFHDLRGGAIYLDGMNIADFARGDLRREFGMVLQDTWLYSGTIRENIRYGRLDATDDEVLAAARAAQVDRFVRTLPDGYDTILNEEATNVSQGQKQLLTIARALLSDSRIMILDEATSSVDTRTELSIQTAMDNLMRGRTSFIIAHRLSTIRNADLILCMKDGDIVEQGTHDELMAKNGFYAGLYNSQFAGSAEEAV